MDKPYRRFHQHTISDSSLTNYGSNDSSPTTTISTVDDSSATEPSPGSSPESPPPKTFTAGMLRPRTTEETSSAPFFELQKPAPLKKGRNLKNLAVNTSRQPGKASSTTSLPIASTPDEQGAASPSFVKPPSPPKRKPSNLGLSITTPANTKAPPQQVRLAIPPTPGFSRPGTLRHFQSSPSLPLFPGLTVNKAARTVAAEKRIQLESIASPVASETVEVDEEDEPNFDVPQSREEKPEAYPDGPICVYDPGIDLYLEPTADQARDYDVIMNVASEVRNPFAKYDQPERAAEGVRMDGGGGIQYAPKREHQPELASPLQSKPESPTTPKATPFRESFPSHVKGTAEQKEPEYVHVPWEHNSDIVPDLLRLVKLIDEKVLQGKRILVHCQCGVSRSASLVVAYGIYKNPATSVQEAYDAVKKRSKWIGPNMNLIMQLQEFRSSLTRNSLLGGHRGFSPVSPSSALSEWGGPFSMTASGGPTPLSTMPMSAGVVPSTTQELTAAIPALSSGPSSAPSGLSWPSGETLNEQDPRPATRLRASSGAKPSSAYVDPAGHVVAVPKVQVFEADTSSPPKSRELELPIRPKEDEQDSATPADPPVSPRAAEFAMTPVQPTKDADPADEYGIMSPTSTEFASSPFDRSALLAALGMGSMRPQDEQPAQRPAPPPPPPARRPTPPKRRSEDGDASLRPRQSPKLRPKASAPSLREQKQLQDYQAQLESQLPSHAPLPSHTYDEPLMSPRAHEFTENPFALSVASVTNTTPSIKSDPTAPLPSETDPRSPVQKGASPITRNIEDVL
ncbi:hypothetical protein MBLNU230_g0210t1 [Neophaeotheca triangularis]